ncbi:glycosyltransferase family 2 protein [Flavobacterium sp. TAB 87]|uniref:glycosyltransferase family 2 protein n=1 Tax=Flavobacterium sp. TAB 87 TaxID=1729581 RepID=UPI00076DC4DF|nr:glycosyltransferase family 2 protein [Flavobacterium sp. TAB 87]KVV15872.1 putative glycosyltransferase EpsJ [Flavobacterium sp. TAB 87]
MNFTVTVIIPVYNCERFIEKAIKSALQQKHVAQVVVVNDGSTDSSLLIIEKFQKFDERLLIVNHENKNNRGRSASRNLGIQKATSKYIAFLDADDYFLENRFNADMKLFLDKPNCDGVYNAVGFYFYRKATERELEMHQLYTVTKQVAPEDLFQNLLYGRCGNFHINGLTVKRSIFENVGLFNEELVVAEDSEMFWKMALKCRLYTGIINQAVAIRGIHDENIFNNEDLYQVYTIKMHEVLAIWCSKNNINYSIVDDLLKWIWMLKYKQQNNLMTDIKGWAKFFFPQPQLMFSILSIKYFPVVRFRKMLFPFLYEKG